MRNLAEIARGTAWQTSANISQCFARAQRPARAGGALPCLPQTAQAQVHRFTLNTYRSTLYTPKNDLRPKGRGLIATCKRKQPGNNITMTKRTVHQGARSGYLAHSAQASLQSNPHQKTTLPLVIIKHLHRRLSVNMHAEHSTTVKLAAATQRKSRTHIL